MTTTEIPLINKLENSCSRRNNTNEYGLTKKAATVQVIIFIWQNNFIKKIDF